MMTTYSTDQAIRAKLLASSLLQVRREADRLGAADVVHELRNGILTIQGALGIVEARLAQGRTDEVDNLLELADTRLRRCRALIARTQRARLVRRLPEMLAV
jgi:signal transduction histidine kinase